MAEQNWITLGRFPGAFGIAVDSRHVYWTRTNAEELGFIARANIVTGSEVEEEWLKAAGGGKVIALNNLVVVGTFIYWAHHDKATKQGWIGRANTNGTEVEPEWLKIAGAAEEVDPIITASSTRIYWSTIGAAEKGNIGRANINGTEAEPEWLKLGAFPGAEMARNLAVNETHIYWSEGRGNEGLEIAKWIGRANITGTEVEKEWANLGEKAAAHNGIVLTAAHIYYANPEAKPGRIGRLKIDGTGLEANWSVLEAEWEPNGIAIDSSYVYWLGEKFNTAGRIGRALSEEEKERKEREAATAPGVGLFGIRPKTSDGVLRCFTPGIYQDHALNYVGNGTMTAYFLTNWEPFAYYIFRHRVKAPFLKKRVRQIFFNGEGQIIPAVFKDFARGERQEGAVVGANEQSKPELPVNFNAGEEKWGEGVGVWGKEVEGTEQIWGGEQTTGQARIYSPGVAFTWSVGWGNNSAEPFTVDSFVYMIQFRKS